MPDKPKTTAENVLRLRVSSYEQASSWLLSLLIALGAAVLILLVLWWTNKVFVPQLAVPVEMTEIGDGEGGGDGRPMGGSQLENPTEEAAAGTDDPPTEVRQDLTAISEVTVEKAAQMDEPQLDDPAVVPRKKQGDYGTGGGMGGGAGDGRGLGHGPGKGGTPRHWELHFLKGSTLDVYARQLDFFGIELAVLMPNDKVAYASNLAKPKPDTRTGAASAEKRYYLTWRGDADLQKADRELLGRAGLDTEGRLILKLLPRTVEAQLAALEKGHRGMEPKHIRKTRFGIQAADNGYTFYVLEQTYR